MFLYDLGDSSILTREEEGRLSEIYQKGTSLEAVTASLKEQLQREPTSAELADALTGSLHGLPEQQLHQACLSASVVIKTHSPASYNCCTKNTWSAP